MKKDSLASLILIFVQVVATFAISGMVTRSLPTNEIAFWFLLSGIVPFVNFFDFGMSIYLTREVPKVRGNPLELRGLVNSVCTGGYLVVLSLYAIFILGSIALKNIQGLTGAQWILIAFFGLGAFLRMASNFSFGALYGLGFISFERLIRAGLYLVYGILSVVVFFKMRTLEGFVLAWLAFGVLSFLVSNILLHFKVSLTARMDTEQLKKAFLAGKQWALVSAPALFINNAQIYIVGLFGTAVDVKIFGLCSQILQGVTALVAVPALVASPKVSAMESRNEKVASRNLVMRVMKYSLTASLFFAVFFSIFGERVLEVWSGLALNISPVFILLLSIYMALEAMNLIQITFLWVLASFQIFGRVMLSSVTALGLGFILARWDPLIGVLGGSLIGQSAFIYLQNYRLLKKGLV